MYTEMLDVDALNFDPALYDGARAYARCKRAQVTLAEEWTRRLLGTGVTVNAMHPGWADTSGIRAALPPEAAEASGLFCLDRRPRTKHRLRRTRRPDGARESERFWQLCCERTAAFTAAPAGPAA